MDRHRLRTALKELSAETLSMYMLASAEKEATAGKEEFTMQKLWVEVLHIPAQLVGRNDSFLQLGGDSLAAIRLVTKARERGIHLSVASIFRDPRLSQVASRISYEESEQAFAEPWSLIRNDEKALLVDTIREQCVLGPNVVIDDIYPTTALQEGLMALATKHPGSYIARLSFLLDKSIEIDCFRAWSRTIELCQTLWTRIVVHKQCHYPGSPLSRA
jgi:aryl carrier-like protein